MANTLGELGKAQKTRGGVAAGKIADDVINRIVANTSSDFQDFLSRQGNGDAGAAASQAIASQPQPEPMPQPIMPAPVMPAPVLSPMYQPQASPMAAISPAPPMLSPYGMQRPDPRMDMLRQFGLI